MTDTPKNESVINDTSSTAGTSHKGNSAAIEEILTIDDIADKTNNEFGENLVYDTAMVSKILGVQESTLRKYCTLMQKHSYEFNKNSVGHRIFYKKDVKIMRQIIDLKNSTSLTLNQSVKRILESDIDDIEEINDITNIDPISKTENHKLIESFNTFKNEQQEFNRQLIEQLQKQQEYIKNSIDERDKKLMAAIKESMEMRRQLAVAEEKNENIKKLKKSKWWKFWIN